jgi:hypothetical protein
MGSRFFFAITIASHWHYAGSDNILLYFEFVEDIHITNNSDFTRAMHAALISSKLEWHGLQSW